MPKPPHWRSLERALLEVFDDYSISYTEERGERFVELNNVEYRVSDLAKELERRL